MLVSVAALLSASLHAQTADTEETVDNLKRQLSAQQAINQQLRQRLEALELELGSQRTTSGPIIVSLDANATPPREIVDSTQSGSAVEEALGEKGLVLLPVGSYRFTPSVSWSHSSQNDTFVFGTSIEAGLPMGMAVSFRQPYVWRDYSFGKNKGLGDFSLGVAKRLNNETATMPSWVARLGYTHDSGKDAFEPISVGSGFRSYELSLSGVKRLEPLVMYGSVTYALVRESNAVVQLRGGDFPVFTEKIDPGNSYGLNIGVSLAATPDISLDIGLSYGFTDKTRITLDSGKVGYGARSTKGNFNFGMAYLISRNMSLSVSTTAGLTRNSNDFGLVVSLPYRF
jgi:uncharacterized coiled-coil protein SlyX